MKAQIILLGTLLMATQAEAGEILRPDAQSGFQWQSTDCPKPILNTDPTLSRQARLDAYSKDITAHIICLQQEAQADFQEAQEEMQAAIERQLAEDTAQMDEMMLQAYRSTER